MGSKRTVAAWQQQAGGHGQRVHAHVVQQSRVDLQHVQADELWVKMVGRRVWMARAMAVPSRLWLGGVIRPRRDLTLITTLVRMVRACAHRTAILVCVDGLASYVTAFRRVFRDPVRTGCAGRLRLCVVPGLLLGQVIKQKKDRRVVGVTRRVVLGTATAIMAVLLATGTETGINTAYIERLNAMFWGAMTPLVRRGRALARSAGTLTAGLFPVDCAYNFCWKHESLCLEGRGKGRGSEVGASDAGDGGRADGSSVDDAGAVEPSRPAATLGRSQASGTTFQAEDSAGGRRGSMTTFVCGATKRKA
ncbi:MAG: hypothetical protein IRY99_14690 [Isosphaeraceae bacterium]|nr:hypothetical protein [Isosphaeraceae bacterium]